MNALPIRQPNRPVATEHGVAVPVGVTPQQIWEAMRLVVTLDGGAGTGKTTVGNMVSEVFGGVPIVDSGKLFRTVGLLLLHRLGDNEIDLPERVRQELPEVLRTTRFSDQSFRGTGVLCFIDTGEVDEVPQYFAPEELESEKAAYAASVIAQDTELRAALCTIQANVASISGCVTMGRAQGRELVERLTEEQQHDVVRIFLHASAEEVATRRFRQQNNRAPSRDELLEMTAQIATRNARDASRAASPSVSLEEASTEGYTIVCSDQPIDRVVRDVVAAVERRHPGLTIR
jgi:cytidylate kinase